MSCPPCAGDDVRLFATTLLCALALVGKTVAASCDPPLGEAASRRFKASLAVGTPYRRPSLPASLSGIAWTGGTNYYAVSDDVFTDEVGLYPLAIELSSNGLSVASCTISPPAKRIVLADAYDLEAVAFDAANGTVWAADETRRTVKEYNPSDGAVLRALQLPDFLRHDRSNLGMESLALSEDRRTLWTCTEESLTCDGPRSSPTNGTTVRFLKFTRPDVRGDFKLSGSYPYTTDAWSQAHDYGGKGRRGVSGLCALPDGSLLVLERELSFGGSNALMAASTARLYFAIYRVEPSIGGKEKLASGGGRVFSCGNYEGICLGPRLPDGKRSVLLVSDAGDGLSPSCILPMVLSLSSKQNGVQP